MRIETLATHLRLLTYLATHPNSTLNIISETLDILYPTAHKMVSKYIDQEIITQSRKEILLLGGDKYEYRLSEKGRQFLKDIYNLLGKSLID